MTVIAHSWCIFPCLISSGNFGWTYGLGLKGQNSTFSERVHVAYQIKGNHEYSSMHGSKYFARRPPPPPLTLGLGSKGQNSTFAEHGHVAYQT